VLARLSGFSIPGKWSSPSIRRKSRSIIAPTVSLRAWSLEAKEFSSVFGIGRWARRGAVCRGRAGATVGSTAPVACNAEGSWNLHLVQRISIPAQDSAVHVFV
jgi:hypothetical protein